MKTIREVMTELLVVTLLGLSYGYLVELGEPSGLTSGLGTYFLIFISWVVYIVAEVVLSISKSISKNSKVLPGGNFIYIIILIILVFIVFAGFPFQYYFRNN